LSIIPIFWTTMSDFYHITTMTSRC
jgi:hypothetical protein